MPIKVAMPIVNAASGAFVVLNVKDNGTAFNPSSGTASFTSLLINPLYNVTGTYIGRITGIDYNPALTSMIGVTHYGALIRSGLVGMGLGATLPTAALHVKSPGNTSSTYCAKFDNSDGVMLLGVNDGKYIEIGGDTFVISVGSTIPSGAAYMEINSNQVLAYFMTDKVGNVIEEITTTTGAISRKLKTELVVDQLAGDCPMTYIQRQSTVAAASTTTTVAAVNMAVSEQIMDVRVQFIITELGGDGGGCNINATIRRSSAGTVALVGAQDKGAGERRIAASGAPDWTCNLVADDTNKRLNINFTNNSATPVPKAFKVTAHIWYTKTIEPSV
jgi:hypothetical protein